MAFVFTLLAVGRRSSGGIVKCFYVTKEPPSRATLENGKTNEFISVYGLWYAVPPLKGGTTYG
jgi:hypothetical protein